MLNAAVFYDHFFDTLRAINWARQRKVGVISMCLTILDDNEDLQREIAQAAEKGALMFASMHDDGLNEHKAYLAIYDAPICTTACAEHEILPQCSPIGYNCPLNCKNIPAGIIPFLVSDDRISVSLVATAVASGLSSLTISCDRFCLPKMGFIAQVQSCRKI